MRQKIDSYSRGVYKGDNGLLQVYADDSMFYKKILKKGWESNQRQNENERQNLHITRQRIRRPRLKRYA